MSIADDKVVSIEYELKEKGGSEILDSNKGAQPLEFVMSKHQLIPGLVSRVAQMSSGETKDIEVPASEAYGEYNPDAFDDIPKEQFAGIELEPGLPLYGQGENGETVQVVVKDIKDDVVRVDYNHPLAGKDLVFTVTVLDVRDATADELATGVIGGGHCGSGNCGCGA